MAIILSLEEIEKLRPHLKDVVLAGGAFDIIHAGHIEHLQEARSLGKTLAVHVTSNKRVKEKKGPHRPIFSEEERARIVAAIRYVDYVFIADVPHYDSIILEIVRPDILFLNHEAVSDTIKKYLDGISSNIKIVISSTPKTNDSSALFRRIKASE